METVTHSSYSRHASPLCPDLEQPESTPIVGVCPQCGLASGFLKIGAQTWHYCNEHKTRWHTENSHCAPPGHLHDRQAWEANAELLAAYEIVEPSPCVQLDGRPSLTRLVNAMLQGQQRDREKGLSIQ